MKKCLFILFFLLVAIQCFAQKQGQLRIDSLLNALKYNTTDTDKVNTLTDLSFTYYSINPDKGIEYGKQALKIAKAVNFNHGIAKANRFIGANYHGKSDYGQAVIYYKRALRMEEELGNKKGMGSNLVNLALVYTNQSEFPKALENYFKGLELFEQIGFKKGISTCLGNIVILYMEINDYNKALEFAKRALLIDTEMNNISGQARHLGNIGLLYSNKNNYSEAMKNFFEGLKKFQEIDDQRGIANVLGNIGDCYLKMFDYANALSYMLQSTKIYEQLGAQKDIASNLGSIGLAYYKVAVDTSLKTIQTGFEKTKIKNLWQAISYSDRAIKLNLEVGAVMSLKGNYENLSNAYAAIGNYKDALKYHQLYQQVRDSIFSNENKKKLNTLENRREIELREKEIAIQKLALVQRRNESFALVGGLVLLLLFVVLVYRQRKISDNLLLNILPKKIAKRLKNGEKPIADAFDDVSIVFIDIANFTKLSTNAPANRIVVVLNDIFTTLDHLCFKHGLEKIKTIGDSYMAAAGLPEADVNHALKTASFAMEAMQVLKGYKTADNTEINFRVGIDCGPVVAGVIGESKFIYDLWGDAVNTAARMEASGNINGIHCSDNFKKECDLFNSNDIVFLLRGDIEIKGKGTMKTWFLKYE